MSGILLVGGLTAICTGGGFLAGLGYAVLDAKGYDILFLAPFYGGLGGMLGGIGGAIVSAISAGI